MVEHKRKSVNDYEFLKSLGEGAFGTVFLAKDKESGTLYAIKALDKSHIIKTNKTKQVYKE
jgi:RAC serine/threonine-protein kinase